ncbi:hypothetical protein SBA1_530054 [Candidatus Sulfotelmatobacter kueseliae]|uniref:Uncharacterized protein n=1 Tax=Candidatus Sulfotelmatobacter kueseliae TaxID=2042962 RepID=A0A2U3KXN4_9BACT|nr:hypothetical protein SBA1_530054 [Candidatus Sulfotelmatobacter kueseliae]
MLHLASILTYSPVNYNQCGVIEITPDRASGNRNSLVVVFLRILLTGSSPL